MFNMDVINIVLVVAIIALVILSVVLLVKRLRKTGKMEKGDLSPLYENSYKEEETIDSAAKKVQKVTGIRQEDMNKIVGALKTSTDKIDELAKKTFSDKKEKPIKENVVKSGKSKNVQNVKEQVKEEQAREDEGIER